MARLQTVDYLIIGGGVMGLAIARALRAHYPGASLLVLEKESDVACHASGRNSGVLHAGFYYSADSLKARFCREGNAAWRAYCEEHKLPLRPCGKLVVARTPAEVEGLHALKRRADKNGVPAELVDEQQTAQIEPHARTLGLALHSPTTAVIDPVRLCQHLRDELRAGGVHFSFGTAYQAAVPHQSVLTSAGCIAAGVVINCAGVEARDIARDFGFAADYTMLPFKGVYLECTDPNPPLRTLLYTVPDVNKPFLGVHFALGVNGGLKIGPTAMPAFWREHYGGLKGFRLDDLLRICGWLGVLMWQNDHHFRDFAIEELRKYSRPYLLCQAFTMVKGLEASSFSRWGRPGIRAQLVNTKTRTLVQDFVVEGDARSLHVLNAVSPSFTCSLAFASWLVQERL